MTHLTHTEVTPINPLLSRGMILILILLCMLQIGKHLIWLPITTVGVDYEKHQKAARCVLKGINPTLGEHNELYLSFNYPVFTALPYLWLAPFDVMTGEALWDIVLVLQVLGCAAMVAFFYTPELPSERKSDNTLARLRFFIVDRWMLIGTFLIVFYTPIMLRFHAGNISPTMLFLMVAFGAAFFNKRERLAGALLACAALVKILPAFLLIVFIVAKRWKVLAGFGAVCGVYLILLLLTGWWRWDMFLFTDVLPNAAYKWYGVSRSFQVFIAGLVYPSALDTPVTFKQLTLIVNLGFFVPISIIVLIVCRSVLREWLPMGIAFISPVLPLLTPLLEYHHHCWAIVGYLAVVRLWVSGRIHWIFYLQIPFLFMMHEAGYLLDINFRVYGLDGYILAMLSELALWIINAAALLWLRFGKKQKDVGGNFL